MAEQRYRVVDRLEAGGMAEVFRGEALSVQGFKKQVAIKRVLPHLAQNKNFISMFLDEARLGARLNHANIVTVFDIGAADNTYFIVMEFVDGCNLKTIIEGLRQAGPALPDEGGDLHLHGGLPRPELRPRDSGRRGRAAPTSSTATSRRRTSSSPSAAR